MEKCENGNMEQMWYTYLEKHFHSRKWKKYYKRIIFYMLSVDLGLKPSFMWDFGPTPVNADEISPFIYDLKHSQLLSDDIVLIIVDDNLFVSNAPKLFHSLEQESFIIDVSDKESNWVVCKTNEFVANVSEHIKKNLKENSPSGKVILTIGMNGCLPTVFGLLLGYPLIYYFKQNYQSVITSLELYTVKCKFTFSTSCKNFLLYSFSCPESLVSPDVESTVNKWFKKLNSVGKIMHEDLNMKQRFEYVNSLNL